MPPFVHKKGCSLKISALFVARRRILNSDEITHAAAKGFLISACVRAEACMVFESFCVRRQVINVEGEKESQLIATGPRPWHSSG